jgi:hypothetical protein
LRGGAKRLTSDVDEAEGFAAVVLGAAVLALAAEACDWDEVMLFAADEVVPLVVGCGTAAVEVEGGGGDERLEVEALCWVATEVLLLDLLVEPTSLRKRLFIDDMKTCRAALAQRQRQMHPHTHLRRERKGVD